MKAIAAIMAIASLFFAGEVRSQVSFRGQTTYWVAADWRQYVRVPHIIISGAPNSSVEIYVEGFPFERNLVADACGLIKLKAGGQIEVLNGASVNNLSFLSINQLPLQLLPRCVNGQLQESRSQPFKTPENEMIFPGFQPGQAYPAILLGHREFSIKLNSCGLGIFRDLHDYELIRINGQVFQPGPQNEAPMIPRCLTVEGRSVPFVLFGWEF